MVREIGEAEALEGLGSGAAKFRVAYEVVGLKLQCLHRVLPTGALRLR